VVKIIVKIRTWQVVLTSATGKIVNTESRTYELYLLKKLAL